MRNFYISSHNREIIIKLLEGKVDEYIKSEMVDNDVMVLHDIVEFLSIIPEDSVISIQ